MKVLIGFDGSDCAKVAIRDLQKAGLPGDTEAVVLSAAEMFVFMASPVPVSMTVPATTDLPPPVRRFRALAAQAMADARAAHAARTFLLPHLHPAAEATET